MLKQATADKLKALLKGFDVDKLIAAIKDDKEADFDVPEVKVFTDVELTSRDESMKTVGIKAGKEIAVKELKEAVGLDYEGEGSKDGKKFIAEYQKKVIADAGIKESDKVREKDSVIEQLRANLTNLTAEKEASIKAAKMAQLDTEILSHTVDRKPDNLTNQEWVAIIKMNNEITEQDGQLVVKRDGKVVANQTDMKPIPVKDALVGFVEERKLGKAATPAPPAPGGRAAGDSKGNPLGISNMKQFKEHLAANGMSENGQQAQALLKQITDTNANFDFKE